MSGANYYGVLVNKASVNVKNSTVHNIGETPFDGMQRGNAISYLNGSTGTVSGTTVKHYQKNGITISGKNADNQDTRQPTSVSVLSNTVTGEGEVSYIAQNGIQISFGATATVRDNTVTGNNYAPSDTEASGLLLYQAKAVEVQTTRPSTTRSTSTTIAREG